MKNYYWITQFKLFKKNIYRLYNLKFFHKKIKLYNSEVKKTLDYII